MTGFNLPPGCNVNDLPGNRPEDEFIERYIEYRRDSADAKDEYMATDEFQEAFIEWLARRAEKVWDDGEEL